MTDRESQYRQRGKAPTHKSVGQKKKKFAHKTTQDRTDKPIQKVHIHSQTNSTSPRLVPLPKGIVNQISAEKQHPEMPFSRWKEEVTSNTNKVLNK